jgi:hypothetical protein
MKIDLKNPNPGVTFYFDESDKKGGGITLRILSGAKLEAITNQCRQKRVEVKGSPPTRFEYLDFKKNGEDKEFELTWDYCLMSWHEVIDESGKAIDCTPENKVMLMRESPMFSSFVMDCVRKVNITNKVLAEDLEGN